jgi:hypothetical protein
MEHDIHQLVFNTYIILFAMGVLIGVVLFIKR